MIVIGSLLFYEIKKANKIDNTGKYSTFIKDFQLLFARKTIIEFFLASAITYTISAIYYYDSSILLAKIRCLDNYFYGIISEAIYSTGYENSGGLTNYFFQEVHGNSPYHYFELWLNGFFSSIFHLPNFICISIILSPCFYFIIYIGLIALFQTHGTITLSAKFIAIGLLFLNGIKLPLEGIPYLEYANGYAYGIMSELTPKFASYYLVIISFILIKPSKYTTISNLVLLTLPILAITSMFAIIGGILLYLLIVFIKKSVPLRFIITNSIYCLVVFLFLFLFYKIMGNTYLSVYSTSEKDLILNLFKDKDWQIAQLLRIIGIELFLQPIKFIVVYLPWLLLALVVLSKTKKSLFSILNNTHLRLLLIIIVGFIVSFLFEYNPNHPQLFFMVSSTITNVFFISLFIKEINFIKKNQLTLISFAGLIAYNIYGYFPKEYNSPHDEKYISNIISLNNSKQSNPIGCFLKAPEEYTTVWSKYTAEDQTGDYLTLMKGYKGVVCLNPHEIPLSKNPLDTALESSFIKTSVFYIFVDKQKKGNTFISMTESQLNFIDRFKINFIVLSKQAKLPPILANRIDTMIEDSRTGERFALLHKK
ncbi:MAG: hypothetical protein JNL63_09190 [Bacteroidia bacterium]|nr:hypothetical protein [Bacteroidia bacterium]